MCGICGVVNLDANHPVERGRIELMTRALAHRGPDDEGYLIEGNVGLGHRRLSIIDLEGGKQPIFNEDASAVVIFNGEIYNYADLTAELVERGHSFRTRSDTEAIVHAYEEYGDRCVDRLRGMFAFAIWDRRRKRLLLARDRLGIKPVYFYLGDRFFAFASEIKALLEFPDLPRQVDPEALELYLALRYVPGPRTMFKNIHKLQPGHLLVLDENGAHIVKYWDVEFVRPEPVPAKFYLERFEQLLEESVRLRLIAEVPLGIFLSGGLDSSSVLAVMSRLTRGERIKAFSVGYEAASEEEEQANELAYARMAAQAFGAEHHEFRLTAADFRDFVPDLVWHLDEPLADDSCIPLYFISRLARKYITVVLSGEGGDEVLAGYGIYRRMLALENIHNRFAPFASSLAPFVARLVRREAASRYLRLASLPLEQRYRGVSKGFALELRRRLLGPTRAAESEERLNEVFVSYYRAVEKAAPLDRMIYVDLKVWLADDLLLKADKMTMANALELRVPLLDHKLVEFSATLPPELKLKGSSGKFLLRSAMAGVLPGSILKRAKKGFPVPTGPWLRAKLRDFTRDALLARDAACRLYLDPDAVREIVREHERGLADRWQELWTLLVFEFWHRLFVERSSGSACRSPDLSGFEATRRIKQAEKSIKVLVLTMYDEEELIARCLDAGASGYVLKDAPAAQLIYAIDTVHRGGKYLSPGVLKKVVSEYVKHSKRPETSYDRLSDREREVLKLLADGLSVKEIATRLNLSVKTVDAHKYNLMRKLDIHDRAELIKYAIQKKLIKLPIIK